ncbi:GNAT family protein [Exiguobacterium flavidum]|uniref:hypothetical protein n=1 Tax=Exiguobacterium flavidum TaxID=2184695 RepID=UPI001E6562EB|nr:hypothetical protein [Exiguobacterium flavidum]
MSIVSYDRLTPHQQQLVHRLLPPTRSVLREISGPACQYGRHHWTLLENDIPVATIGLACRNKENRTEVHLLNSSYSKMAAFKKLALHVHRKALSLHPDAIHVHISPPRDNGFISVWASIGYTSTSEEFRIIGTVEDRPPTLTFKSVSDRERHLFLSLRNDAMRQIDKSYQLTLHDFIRMSELKSFPCLVYDGALPIGTLIWRREFGSIVLDEITRAPAYEGHGYGPRILDSFFHKIHHLQSRSFSTSCLSTNRNALALYDQQFVSDIQHTSSWYTFRPQISR